MVAGRFKEGNHHHDQGEGEQERELARPAPNGLIETDRSVERVDLDRLGQLGPQAVHQLLDRRGHLHGCSRRAVRCTARVMVPPALEPARDLVVLHVVGHLGHVAQPDRRAPL